MNIKPIESYQAGYFARKRQVCRKDKVRKLEANYEEAIEALLTECVFQHVENDSVNWDMVGIIEKATGKKWEEIIK